MTHVSHSRSKMAQIPDMPQTQELNQYLAQDRAQTHSAKISLESQQVPLVLDLDGTLLRSDLLLEGIVDLCRRNPLNLGRIALWTFRGKAFLKQKVAETARIDYTNLPVNEPLAAYAVAQKAAGRRIVIATAADQQAARQFAIRFPFVDEIIGSDGATNFKGETKAAMLQWRYPQGFDYAGDSAADLPVWKACRKMILVEPGRRVAQQARAIKPVELLIEAPAPRRLLAGALRVHQWAKNALIFAPLLLAGLTTNWVAWTHALAAFAGLSLVASATYLINDLIDLPHDRAHRSKSRRALASGHMGLARGAGLALACLGAGLVLGAAAGAAAFGFICLYGALTLGYSLYLKRVPFLDTLTLAGLFTLRLEIGTAAVGAHTSIWLLTFSMFLFTSLSLAKRHVEITHLRRARGRAMISGRGYRGDDEPIVAAFGVAAAIASILIFVLYLVNEAFHKSAFTFAPLLWVFPPILFLWLARIWLLCARREMDEDPVAFSMRDRLSLFAGLTTFLVFASAMGLRL